MKVSPDGRPVALADFEEGPSIHEIVTGKRLATVKGTLSWLASSADGVPRALVVREGTARLVSLQPDDPNAPSSALPHLSGASWAVSPDGRRLAVATEGGGKGRLAIIDHRPGVGQGASADGGLLGLRRRPMARPFLHDAGDEISVEDVAFSADETLLAATDRAGLTTLWDVKQGKVAKKFQGPGARASTPDFSADGALLSVVFSNGQASLFSLGALDMELIRIRSSPSRAPGASSSPPASRPPAGS